jgi:hypothetical protein
MFRTCLAPSRIASPLSDLQLRFTSVHHADTTVFRRQLQAAHQAQRDPPCRFGQDGGCATGGDKGVRRRGGNWGVLGLVIMRDVSAYTVTHLAGVVSDCALSNDLWKGSKISLRKCRAPDVSTCCCTTAGLVSNRAMMGCWRCEDGKTGAPIDLKKRCRYDTDEFGKREGIESFGRYRGTHGHHHHHHRRRRHH